MNKISPPIRMHVDRASTDPQRTSHRLDNGQIVHQSTTSSAGRISIGATELDFEKYFVSELSYRKKRADFVVVRTPEAPQIAESFERLNRALLLGPRAVRNAEAIIGATLREATPETACGPSSTDFIFGIQPPLSIADLAEIDMLDVKSDGTNLFWVRTMASGVGFHFENPATRSSPESTSAVIISTESPNMTHIHPEHARWDRADAFLTPSDQPLPGVLGSLSLRTELIRLAPGVTGDIPV